MNVKRLVCRLGGERSRTFMVHLLLLAAGVLLDISLAQLRARRQPRIRRRVRVPRVASARDPA